MSVQIAIRLNDEELNALDLEIKEGRAANRSEALRRAVANIRREQRYRREEERLVELIRRGELVYPDLDRIRPLTHPRLD